MVNKHNWFPVPSSFPVSTSNNLSCAFKKQTQQIRELTRWKSFQTIYKTGICSHCHFDISSRIRNELVVIFVSKHAHEIICVFCLVHSSGEKSTQLKNSVRVRSVMPLSGLKAPNNYNSQYWLRLIGSSLQNKIQMEAAKRIMLVI